MPDIAQRLAPHSTIYRKLKRNRFVDPELQHLSGDHVMKVQSMAKACRIGLRKLIRHNDRREVVVERLKTG